MIYLDNSATTYPKPPEVIRAFRSAPQYYGFNPGRGGYRRSLKTAQKVYEARETVRKFFHMSSIESVIFVPSCTQALNTVIKGVLKKGDHVIISSYEHNAVARPIHKLQQEGIITYSVAQADINDADKTVENFRRLINARTKLIVCTHASNVFGYRLPVERLCALAHSNGLLFCLDAAQSAGILPIDMERDRYDFVCCAGHKYLYGPMGIGLLLIGNDNDVESLIEGGTGSVSDDLSMPSFYPDKLEAGTMNIAGIIGLQSGVNFVAKKGIDRIFESENRLIDYLSKRLSAFRHIKVFRPAANSFYHTPVLSFTAEDKDSETIVKYLSEKHDIAVRGGLHCAPLAHRSMNTQETGTVRISPSVFTTQNDMDLLIDSLRKFR
ncbi:MAG: aminotransferase class V-fold PLP-dependent enzyme [Ruminococcus sp.]|nr:aminotransferase class V-fold PLP-dependent enzyme [Ruminococcus sp.]